MAILVDKSTRVVFQGITGSAGSFHAKQCIAYGTQVVAGCTPLRGGEVFEAKGPDEKAVQVPVFDTVGQAVQATQANTSIIFVPPLGAADAILEALDAGCRLIVCITEGIPVTDMIRVRRALDTSSATLLGPNCPGVISPGKCKLARSTLHRAVLHCELGDVANSRDASAQLRSCLAAGGERHQEPRADEPESASAHGAPPALALRVLVIALAA